MKERETPETDGAAWPVEMVHQDSNYESWVRTDFARKLGRERDELLAALERANQKLRAYVGMCSGDKELTDTVLPMAEAAIAAVKGTTP